MFKISNLIHDRDVMRPEKLVERASEKLLHVFSGLGLNQTHAALKVTVKVSADMGLPFAARGLVARRAWGSLCLCVGWGCGDRWRGYWWRNDNRRSLAPARLLKLLLYG
jgi:hypothetical protein